MSMDKKTVIKKRIIRFIPMIIMMIIIFAFSAMPGDDSSSTSEKILNPLLKAMEGISHHKVGVLLESVMHTLIRKCAHFLEYAILASLAVFAIYRRDLMIKRLLLYSQLISTLYACTDEFHQCFVPGRSAQFTDVIIDSLGALTGLTIVLLTVHSVRKRKRKNEAL